MNNHFSANLLAKHTRLPARIMQIHTPHGDIQTPAFMPVGTRAFVNLMTPEDLSRAGSQIILGGNTYHMLCSPGMTVIEKAGGMHSFMGWEKPMLTDSGGFQVFSLSQNDLCKIDENGAHFRHPITNQALHLTSKTSIEAQKIIGADIIMAFDQCTPDNLSESETQKIMQRTHRWLLESKTLHDNNPLSAYGFKQALFGIIQGGCHRQLREQSAEFVMNTDCDGIAIGGESIGFLMSKTVEIIRWIQPFLPDHKVRYTMGVGLHPQDLIDVVAEGIDIFDCVAPTRNARHGALYHGIAEKHDDWVKFNDFGERRGQILIKKSQYATQDQPILAGCTCHTCKHHSRAYLHYLFKLKSPAYHQLACIHNIHVMHQVCDAMRQCIIYTK